MICRNYYEGVEEDWGWRDPGEKGVRGVGGEGEEKARGGSSKKRGK